MNTYYFTFGQDHLHPETHIPLKTYWIEILAPSIGEARDVMFQHYGAKWAFCYTEKDFNKHYFPGGCFEQLSA